MSEPTEVHLVVIIKAKKCECDASGSRSSVTITSLLALGLLLETFALIAVCLSGAQMQ